MLTAVIVRKYQTFLDEKINYKKYTHTISIKIDETCLLSIKTRTRLGLTTRGIECI